MLPEESFGTLRDLETGPIFLHGVLFTYGILQLQFSVSDYAFIVYTIGDSDFCASVLDKAVSIVHK